MVKQLQTITVIGGFNVEWPPMAKARVAPQGQELRGLYRFGGPLPPKVPPAHSSEALVRLVQGGGSPPREDAHEVA
eukprot:3192920-Alexandrium_andersonii.AAC.1